MISFILVLSFFLEAIFSNLIIIDSGVLLNCFSIISLVILYPYFKDKKTTFFITTIIIGIFYDIAFTNTLFINTAVFIVASFFICWFYKYVTFNFFSQILLTILIVLINRIFTYFILCIFDYTVFNDNILINSILSSIGINVIYSMLMFFIVRHFCKVDFKKII